MAGVESSKDKMSIEDYGDVIQQGRRKDADKLSSMDTKKDTYTLKVHSTESLLRRLKKELPIINIGSESSLVSKESFLKNRDLATFLDTNKRMVRRGYRVLKETSEILSGIANVSQTFPLSILARNPEKEDVMLDAVAAWQASDGYTKLNAVAESLYRAMAYYSRYYAAQAVLVQADPERDTYRDMLALNESDLAKAKLDSAKWFDSLRTELDTLKRLGSELSEMRDDINPLIRDVYEAYDDASAFYTTRAMRASSKKKRQFKSSIDRLLRISETLEIKDGNMESRYFPMANGKEETIRKELELHGVGIATAVAKEAGLFSDAESNIEVDVSKPKKETTTKRFQRLFGDFSSVDEKYLPPSEIAPSDLPKYIADTFNIGSVEMGNWVGQKSERELFLTRIYAGLSEIAERMGVDKSVIGLDGRVHVQLGARGKGRASAHMQPYVVDGKVMVGMNFTKTKGHGSLFHEYVHALDCIANNVSLSDRNTNALSRIYLASEEAGGLPQFERQNKLYTRAEVDVRDLDDDDKDTLAKELSDYIGTAKKEIKSVYVKGLNEKLDELDASEEVRKQYQETLSIMFRQRMAAARGLYAVISENIDALETETEHETNEKVLDIVNNLLKEKDVALMMKAARETGLAEFTREDGYMHIMASLKDVTRAIVGHMSTSKLESEVLGEAIITKEFLCKELGKDEALNDHLHMVIKYKLGPSSYVIPDLKKDVDAIFQKYTRDYVETGVHKQSRMSGNVPHFHNLSKMAIRVSSHSKSHKEYLMSNVEMLARTGETWYAERSEKGCDQFVVSSDTKNDVSYAYSKAFMDKIESMDRRIQAGEDKDNVISDISSNTGRFFYRNFNTVARGKLGYSESSSTMEEYKLGKERMFKALDRTFLEGGKLNPQTIWENIVAADMKQAAPDQEKNPVMFDNRRGTWGNIQIDDERLNDYARASLLTHVRFATMFTARIEADITPVDTLGVAISSLASFNAGYQLRVFNGYQLRAFKDHYEHFDENSRKAMIETNPSYVSPDTWLKDSDRTPELVALAINSAANNYLSELDGIIRCLPADEIRACADQGMLDDMTIREMFTTCLSSKIECPITYASLAPSLQQDPYVILNALAVEAESNPDFDRNDNPVFNAVGEDVINEDMVVKHMETNYNFMSDKLIAALPTKCVGAGVILTALKQTRASDTESKLALARDFCEKQGLPNYVMDDVEEALLLNEKEQSNGMEL